MRLKYILFALTTLLFVSCKTTPQSDKSIITVTIEPLRYFTESIVGDKFDVISIVPKGSSPETYDPTPQQLVNLAQSVAYIKIGYIGFELNWMDRIKSNSPDLTIYDSSKGINLIHAEGHQHGDHFHAGGVEPHTWNSTLNAEIMAKNILNIAVELDSINKEYYEKNYAELITKIKKTDEEVRTILANKNSAKGFMIYHPALSYFARDYNLEQLSIEHEGKEPTPSHLKNLIEHCQNEKIHVIFIQPEFDQKNAEVIAQQTKSNIIKISPLSYDWHEEMIHVANSLIIK